MSRVTSATCPCSWGVWYADGTPSGAPWPVFLDGAAQAGYKELELGPDGYLPRDNGQLREELGRRGLAICSGTACYPFHDSRGLDSFRPELDALCHRLVDFGAKYLVVMDGSDVGLYSEKKAGHSARDWNTDFATISMLGLHTKREYGIEAVFHPHIRSLVETEREIEMLMDATGLRLCFDIGHHAYVNGNGEMGDESALRFMRRHATAIAYLHFKNVDRDIFARVKAEGLDSDTAFDMDVMCDLADGIVDYREVKKVLDEIAFEGIGVVEQDLPGATPSQALAAAERNLIYLREVGIFE